MGYLQQGLHSSVEGVSAFECSRNPLGVLINVSGQLRPPTINYQVEESILAVQGMLSAKL